MRRLQHIYFGTFQILIFWGDRPIKMLITTKKFKNFGGPHQGFVFNFAM